MEHYSVYYDFIGLFVFILDVVLAYFLLIRINKLNSYKTYFVALLLIIVSITLLSIFNKFYFPDIGTFLAIFSSLAKGLMLALLAFLIILNTLLRKRQMVKEI